jgi:hypothetical protein
MYQSVSRVPEAAHQSRPQCPEAADLSRRRSVLVDSPPHPLAAKRPDERVSSRTPSSAAPRGSRRRGARFSGRRGDDGDESVYNALMHETRKFLEHGLPDTTAGEFIATALVDAATGNMPGSAFRPLRDRAA